METIWWRSRLATWAFGAAFLGLLSAGRVPAQAPPPPPDDLRARMEKLEQENKAMSDRLQQVLSGGPVQAAAARTEDEKRIQQLVADAVRAHDEEKKRADDKKKADEQAKKDAEGYVIGTDLGMTGTWRPTTGLWFSTPNGDFQSHMGFWMQWDTGYFSQSQNLKPASQIGTLEDDTFFRRIRPFWEGKAWDMVDWNLILVPGSFGCVAGVLE
jgi:hypothetical protein